MLLRRSVIALSKQAVKSPVASRSFTSCLIRGEAHQPPAKPSRAGQMVPFAEIESETDLLPPGAKPGTVPTDEEQATGLERLEILGKMEGIDVFDMKPLDGSRKGTLEDPIIVKSAGDEQFAGCTGFPVDSHVVLWQGMSRERPVARCPECGSVYKMQYVGPPEDEHHDHHGYVEPKNFSHFVKPQYW